MSDDSSDESSISSEASPTGVAEETGLDACINSKLEDECFSLARLVRGQPQLKKTKLKHLRPMVYARFNTSLGKTKPVTLKCLLDSGASASLVVSQHTSKLRTKDLGSDSKVWTTPAGELKTQQKVRSQITIPELHSDRVIDWNFHVTESLGAYDMIIGRDMMEFLGIDIRFSNHTIEWDFANMPFKDSDETFEENHYAQDGPELDQETERIKKILDAKYVPANLHEVVSLQTQLQADQQAKLLKLLQKYEILFDGTLGKWTGTKVNLELNEGATPYHARSYPVPRVHLQTLKMEVERLCELGVLKRVNRSQWAAPTFIIPKKDKTVRFISDFRELNKRIKRRPYPIPHIQDMLTNLEGFQYATSLDLNMGYYHLELDERSKELCTIVLPFGKFEYQRIPMGLCNSPDIFQEKMNEHFTVSTLYELTLTIYSASPKAISTTISRN